MAVQTDLTLQLRSTLTKTAEFGTPTYSALFPFQTKSLTNGTGADQNDLMYSGQLTINATSRQNLDLAGAAPLDGDEVQDQFGNVLSFARVKMIAIHNASTAADAIIDVGGGSDGNGLNALANWVGAGNDKIRIRPGGVLVLLAPDATGYAVTPGTGDLLSLYNAGSSQATVNVLITGASA